MELTTERWCVFDLYGTLVDVDWREVKIRVLSAAGVDKTSVERAVRLASPKRLVGACNDADQEWRWICHTAGIPSDQVAERLRDVEKGAILDTWHEIAPVVALVRQVRSMGCGVAVSSNCYRETADILRSSSLMSLVDTVFLSCEMGVAKPHRSYFEVVKKSLGGKLKEVVYLDDKVENCSSASRLGFRTLHVKAGMDQRSLAESLDQLLAG